MSAITVYPEPPYSELYVPGVGPIYATGSQIDSSQLGAVQAYAATVGATIAQGAPPAGTVVSPLATQAYVAAAIAASGGGAALAELAVAASGTGTVGQLETVTGTGITRAAPAPAAGTVGQMWGVKNGNTTASGTQVTVTYPGPSGATVTVALDPDESKILTQETATAWETAYGENPDTHILNVVNRSGAYVAPPTLTDTATIYVAVDGNDAHDGKTWATAKATVAAAQAALPANGGTVELGYGQYPVSSWSRVDNVTYSVNSATVADTSVTNADNATIANGGIIGCYLVGAYLPTAVTITAVTPGVGFTIDAQTAAATSAKALIVRPAVTLNPGVRLRGRGSSASSKTGNLNFPGVLPALTEIVDSGTGITVLNFDDGQVASGLGYFLEDLAITGNANNWFGLYINDVAMFTCFNVDFRSHGVAGASNNFDMNQHYFVNCRFTDNGTTTATRITGGFVGSNPQNVSSSGVKFDDCWFWNNYGWGITGADVLDDTTGTGTGIGTLYLDSSQVTGTTATNCAGSGVGVQAYPGLAGCVSIKDTWFESNDVMSVLKSGSGPLTVLGGMYNGAGDRTHLKNAANNTYGIEASGPLVVVGATFNNNTYASICPNVSNVAWAGCYSNDPAFIGVNGIGVYAKTAAAGGLGYVVGYGETQGGLTTYPGTATSVALTSGTAWQNTTGSDVLLTIPLTFTAGGTAAVARGTSSSPANLGTITRPAAATDVVEYYVPNQWYFEATLTGASFTANATAQPV